MQIDLEAKCTATHKWVLVARFESVVTADETARHLSKRDGGSYRVTDRRWPEDPASPVVMIFTNGEEV
jgi:hypothetical protein